MNDFGFEPFSNDFGCPTSGEPTAAVAGPYIPEIRDCLSCGLCVSKCPTYRIRREENFSPRGRIRLIERVLIKQEMLDEAEQASLDACTLCRACETVCPSRMAFADLFRQAVESAPYRPPQDLTIRLLLDHVVKRRRVQRALGALLSVYQRTGLQWLLRRLPLSPLRGTFGRLEALLPAPVKTTPIPEFNPAVAPKHKNEVALFTGCVANFLDTQTHQAITKVLTRLGYDVRVLKDQACCGAIYAHNGDIEQARICAQQNRDAVSSSDAVSVIHSASGCGAFLRDYPTLLADGSTDTEVKQETRITDILDFLAGSTALEELSFRPLKARVAVHEPCSQRNVLKNEAVVYEMLRRIPELEVVPLPDNAMCCGAGGTKMLTQPEIAGPLRKEKMQAMETSDPDLLVSSNLSCALHLACGIREEGRDLAVIHPVTLLAQQIV